LIKNGLEKPIPAQDLDRHLPFRAGKDLLRRQSLPDFHATLIIVTSINFFITSPVAFSKKKR
jgi:hypothetical protein